MVNMWGSALIGDLYDAPHISNDQFTKQVVNTLAQHPDFNTLKIPTKSTSTIFVKEEYKEHKFAKNGDGWLESSWGKSANQIIRECRKARRTNKDNREMYDAIITDVQTLKSMEVEATINALTWAEGMDSVIKNMGLTDKNLKSLRKFGETRAVSLQKACHIFLKANTVLEMLNEKVDWDKSDQSEWVNAIQLQKDARKMWRNVLHQAEKLNTDEQTALSFASDTLEKCGPLSARELISRGAGTIHRDMTPKKLSALLKMYGEEYDLFKGGRTSYIKLGQEGIIIKDIWSYMAGSLDSDGSIFISERGDPRVTFVASGNMGKQLCTDLQKAVGCGRLVTDQKVAKNTKKMIHRLIFSSKDDIRQVLKGSLPHMRLKGTQAKAVLAYVDEKDKMRKHELYQLVTYSNWKDHKEKADALLDKWGLGADTIGTFAEGL